MAHRSQRDETGGVAWQLLVDSASDAYISIDADGVVTGWNARAVELFGWSHSEAVGKLLADVIVPPEFQEAHISGIRRFLTTGRGTAVFQRLQLPAMHRSGRRVDVEFTILPVEDPRTGWEFHAFLRDVTAELAQQRYVRLLQQVALAGNEATTVEAAVRATVQAVQEATGSRFAHAYLVEGEGTTARLVPTGWWHPVPNESLARATAAATFAVGEGLPGRVAAADRPVWVADIAHDDNFPRAAEAVASDVRAAFAFPVTNDHRVVAVIELFVEVPGEPGDDLLEVMRSVGTQLGRVFEREHRLDELRHVIADREAIVAMVGHELRGPLAAAHAAAGLLDDQRRNSGDDHELLELLDRQLGRLRRLVDMFVTAQRLESGSLRVRSAPVALADLARQVAADGDFDVRIEVDDVRAFVDPDHVAQMLWNLLANATRHGRPPVHLTAERHGTTVALAVTDAGPGVPAELRAQLFQRFARGASSQGTGLGLAIVRGLALANGGDVDYRDDLPGGPTFAVHLPAA